MDGYDALLDRGALLPEGPERDALVRAYDLAWAAASSELGLAGTQPAISLDRRAGRTSYQMAHDADTGEDRSFIEVAPSDLAYAGSGARFRARQYCVMDSPGSVYLSERLLHESVHALHAQLRPDLASLDEVLVEGVAEVGAYRALLQGSPDRETVEYVSNWVAHHLVVANLRGELGTYRLDEVPLPFELPEANLAFIQSQLDWASRHRDALLERNRPHLDEQGVYASGFVAVCRELAGGRTLRDVAERGLGGGGA